MDIDLANPVDYGEQKGDSQHSKEKVAYQHVCVPKRDNGTDGEKVLHQALKTPMEATALPFYKIVGQEDYVCGKHGT